MKPFLVLLTSAWMCQLIEIHQLTCVMPKYFAHHKLFSTFLKMSSITPAYSSKIYNRTKIQHPTLIGASVIPTLRIRAAAMLVSL